MIIKRNQELFDELRQFDLPIGEYLIIASGPMGIRMLREISDVDLKVTDKLWAELAKTYEIFYDECEVMKLRLSDNIEAMCEASFKDRNQDAPKIDQQIKEAEMIDGLPFENIQTTLYFKRKSTREKDAKDVVLIEKWLKNNNNFVHNPRGIPKEINTGFKIPEPTLWTLDLPVEEIPISEITNNLEIPYLEREGTDEWNLCIRELVENFENEPHHAKQTMVADLSYPIELYFHLDQWIILDGVHRLTKAVREGRDTILVHRIPESAIKEILEKA